MVLCYEKAVRRLDSCLRPPSVPNGTASVYLPGDCCAQAASATSSHEQDSLRPIFLRRKRILGRNFLVYVPPRDDVRVDLYDKDTLRFSLKVSIPNTNRVDVFDATVMEDGRLLSLDVTCLRRARGTALWAFPIQMATFRRSSITEKFSPMQVTTCDGATVWARGWLRTGPDLDRESNMLDSGEV